MTRSKKNKPHTKINRQTCPTEGMAILRTNDIVTLSGSNRMQVWRWEQEEDFPKAIRLSERRKGWWRHEIYAFFENRKIL